MPRTRWKVGELAERTGVSVRTLHYYEELGLLTPSDRTPSGHRLYTADDVARLQQIRSLQQLGLSLDEVGACLRGRDYSPLGVVERHLAQAREQLEAHRRLCQRLEMLAGRLREEGPVGAEESLRTIEVMTMLEKYYTPEQLEELKAR